jgi:hypothetical protein
LRPCERENIGSALTLAVDADAAYLVDQRINERASRITAKDANLLAVVDVMT